MDGASTPREVQEAQEALKLPPSTLASPEAEREDARSMSEKQSAHLERARRQLRRCRGQRQDGGACRMPALRGSRFCLQHDETELGEMARASAGRKSRYQLEADKHRREGQRAYRISKLRRGPNGRFVRR